MARQQHAIRERSAMNKMPAQLHVTNGSANAITRRRFVTLAAGTASLALAPVSRSRAQAAGVVKIGHIQPLTGPSAAYGIRARDGAIIAVDEINAAGGWTDAAGKKYQIEMSVGDMANDAKQAITLFRQYATDPQVIAVLGPTNSVGYVPLVPVAGQIKLPSIGNGSGAPIKEWNPYGFRVNPVATVAVPVLLQKVVAKEGIMKLAVIYDQTNVCKELASKIGFEIVAFEAFRAGDQDFSPQITKIRSLKPDAIYVAAATGDGIKVVSQIREAGIDKRLITGYGSFQDPVYWDGTRGVVKGDYTWLAQDLTSPSAPLKTFLDKYNARFTQQEATSFSTYGYDSVMALMAALKKAGEPDRDKVAAAFADFDVTTSLGTRITFKNPPDGNNINPSVVAIQITGRGSYVAV
jgi:branched-chain amino acid transport system substrate-binding protein